MQTHLLVMAPQEQCGQVERRYRHQIVRPRPERIVRLDEERVDVVDQLAERRGAEPRLELERERRVVLGQFAERVVALDSAPRTGR